MTAPVALQVVQGSTQTRAFSAGRVGLIQPPEAHPNLPPTQTPSSVPGTSVPPFPTTGAQTIQSAFEIASSPLPLQGRYSRLQRGGVGIKGLRSPGRGKSATGPELKDGISSLKPLCHPAVSVSSPGTQNLHPPSRLAGSRPRSSRATSARNANSCSQRSRRSQLCQLVRRHFDQQNNRDLWVRVLWRSLKKEVKLRGPGPRVARLRLKLCSGGAAPPRPSSPPRRPRPRTGLVP